MKTTPLNLLSLSFADFAQALGSPSTRTSAASDYQIRPTRSHALRVTATDETAWLSAQEDAFRRLGVNI